MAKEKLPIEREATAAVAEALEAAIDFDKEHSVPSNMLGSEHGEQDPMQRTSEYVYQHSRSAEDVLSPQESKGITRIICTPPALGQKEPGNHPSKVQ